MDADFNVAGEFQLKEKRYSNFHGWCAMPDAIAVYVDNLLDDEVYEDLVLDKITPVRNDRLNVLFTAQAVRQKFN